MRFSERHGHKTVRQAIQIESVTDELRNALWSVLKVHVWDNVLGSSYPLPGHFLSANPKIAALCKRLWFEYFKQPLDTLSNDWAKVLPGLRAYFFKCPWYEVYDFLEFVLNQYQFGSPNDKNAMIQSCNYVLQREGSAYRLVEGLITRITDEVEIKETEAALAEERGAVRAHLQRALELLSDRKAPDYRNSVKESISAVESLV